MEAAPSASSSTAPATSANTAPLPAEQRAHLGGGWTLPLARASGIAASLTSDPQHLEGRAHTRFVLLVHGPAIRNKSHETTGRISTALSTPAEPGAVLDSYILVLELNSGGPVCEIVAATDGQETRHKPY